MSIANAHAYCTAETADSGREVNGCTTDHAAMTPTVGFDAV